MTLDHLDRMAAYASAPDVYDAPTPSEIKKAVDEIRKAREFAAMLSRTITGGGYVVTFSNFDLQNLDEMKGPQNV